MPRILTNLDAANVARIVNLPNPVAPGDVANKAYVDSVAQGLTPKAPVWATTVGDIVLSGLGTQANGDWTTALTAGDRVLVKNQALPVQNGIYVAAAGGWTRSPDMPAGSHARSVYCMVSTGTTLADTGWVCTTDSPDVVGTDPITFVQFSGAGAITASTGLTRVGNDIRAVVDTVSIQVNLSNQLEVVPAARFTGHKVTALIGDGVNNTFVITHGLNVRTVLVMIRDAVTNELVTADIEATNLTQITVSFISIPTLNAYEVTIIG
jgi:hypothetical protein